MMDKLPRTAQANIRATANAPEFACLVVHATRLHSPELTIGALSKSPRTRWLLADVAKCCGRPKPITRTCYTIRRPRTFHTVLSVRTSRTPRRCRTCHIRHRTLLPLPPPPTRTTYSTGTAGLPRSHPQRITLLLPPMPSPGPSLWAVFWWTGMRLSTSARLR